MHPLVAFLYLIWAIALYVFPTAIAFSRKKRHRWIIAGVNILGDWIYGGSALVQSAIFQIGEFHEDFLQRFLCRLVESATVPRPGTERIQAH